MPEKNFSLEYAKEEVRKNFSLPMERLEWEQIIEPWNHPTAERDKGLVIVLDGLEAAEPSHIAFQLSQLQHSLVLTSPAQVKVVVSCRDTEFKSLMRQKTLPFFQRTTTIDSETASPLTYIDFEIRDFTNPELDEALENIGAVELLREWNAKGEFDSHTAALRDLLKHPGTFEHYAELFARGQISFIQEETWSSLIEKRLGFCLREVERETQIEKEKIKNHLIELAKYCREQKKRDFVLDLSELRERFPDWFAQKGSASFGLYAALIKSGVLEERAGSDDKELAAFKITDAGAYFLSFALEEEYKAATITPVTGEKGKLQIVSAWLSEEWSFSPVRDAVLALIDRLSFSAEERRTELMPLLETIISTHHNNSLFRLMRPSVLEYIFKLLQKPEKSGAYPHNYFEAAREVRYSSENEELLRRNFTDMDPAARELAAELTGIYGLAKFVPQLIELLKDENEDVRSAVFPACGKIGVPVIEPLLRYLDAPGTGAELKRMIAVALINIGHLNKQVSEFLSGEFETALHSGDKETLERLLLAAAHLRDRSQVEYVLQALNQNDNKIIWYAAKFFTEVPDERAFEPLREILGEIDFPHSPDIQNRWYFEQVIAALVKTDRDRIAPELKKLFEKSLKNYEENPGEKHLFRPSRITELAEKHVLPDCYPLLFNYLVKILRKTPASVRVFNLTEALEKVWHPESLKQMISTGGELTKKGVNVARLFVDAIAPNIKDNEDVYGDRLNRVSHLHPAIKSGAPNFVTEAGRLLKKA